MAPNLKLVEKPEGELASKRPGGYVDPQWSGKYLTPQRVMTAREAAIARLPDEPTREQLRRALFTYDGRPRYTGVHA